MEVDKIIKNEKVFTSVAVNHHASAFAVKDGRFVYVVDEEGLKDFVLKAKLRPPRPTVSAS